MEVIVIGNCHKNKTTGIRLEIRSFVNTNVKNSYVGFRLCKNTNFSTKK